MAHCVLLYNIYTGLRSDWGRGLTGQPCHCLLQPASQRPATINEEHLLRIMLNVDTMHSTELTYPSDEKKKQVRSNRQLPGGN